MSSQPLVDFAVVTIFAREVLEGSIIIGEYRTIILRGDSLRDGFTKQEALKEVTLSALFATALALLLIAAIAIPLAVLSTNFDPSTAKIIEGVSKIVAGISLLQLSLKLPKWLGVYGSSKKKKSKRRGENEEDVESQTKCARLACFKRKSPVETSTQGDEEESEHSEPDNDGLSRREIRFNVAWNIWREVAECGVFLIPFFLTGEGVIAIPLSGVIGCAVGLVFGLGIYFANRRFKNRTGLAIFAVLLLVFLSAGLFSGGCHNLEVVIGSTKQVWSLDGEFWSVDRLPMTLLKPFGYNDSRTVLEIVCFWGWLLLSALLHLRKYLISPKPDQQNENEQPAQAEEEGMARIGKENSTVDMGESSVEDGGSISDRAEQLLENEIDSNAEEVKVE